MTLLGGKRTKKIQRMSMMQGKIYHMKNPLLVAARNAAMRYTNIPGNDLKSIHDYDAHHEIKIDMHHGGTSNTRMEPPLL